MSTEKANPFDEKVIDGVSSHMNLDHEDDSLLIVRSLGNRPNAESATVSYLDGEGLDFEAIEGGKKSTVRVPWSKPLTERGEVRVDIERMYYEACAALGVKPREAEEH